jgi:hypothetical protein
LRHRNLTGTDFPLLILERFLLISSFMIMLSRLIRVELEISCSVVKYEVISIISGTRPAICTAVVVARYNSR